MVTVCFSYFSSNITIRQMASQLSGLQREAPCNNKGLKQCQMSNEEILKILSSEYLIHPPWTKPSYRSTYVNSNECYYINRL